MRPKLLLLALLTPCAGMILGQNEPTLVGLPQYGVTGTPDNPEIVNNSGRTILGYVIWSRDANGLGPVMPVLKTREMRLALVRPASASAPTATPPQFSFFGVGPIVQAILGAVVFDDGQFVGSDRGHSFDILSGRIDGERTVAQSVMNKSMSWDAVETLAKQRLERRREILGDSTDGRQGRPPQGSIQLSVRHDASTMFANELFNARRMKGEAAALAMADWTAKLPVVWRAQ